MDPESYELGWMTGWPCTIVLTMAHTGLHGIWGRSYKQKATVYMKTRLPIIKQRFFENHFWGSPLVNVDRIFQYWIDFEAGDCGLRFFYHGFVTCGYLVSFYKYSHFGIIIILWNICFFCFYKWVCLKLNLVLDHHFPYSTGCICKYILVSPPFLGRVSYSNYPMMLWNNNWRWKYIIQGYH